MSSSLEDYLECILLLEQQEGLARSSDIAKRLNVKMSSVNSALKRLAELKLITHSPYSEIHLTKKGGTYAREIWQRHRMLTTFFEQVLNIASSVAAENACRIEHQLDPEVLLQMSVFLKKFQAKKSK